MTPVDEAPAQLTCARCGRAIDGCAFCQQDECREVVCYRCVRITLRQQLAEPHLHGG